jgi:predicted ATPase
MIKWFTSDIYRNQAERPFSPEENEQISKLLRENQNGVYGNELTQMIERLVGFAKGKIYTHTQLILEEPEQNLFPNTQCDLIDFILASINHGKDHRMLMTTHSPYVLNYLNVLLNRSEDSNAYLRENLLSVYRLHEGTVQNLVGKDESGSIIVDSIDLSETMQNIYEEYNQLSSL